MASGRKHLAKQRRRLPDVNPVDLDVTDFPMPCPCCRQPFLLPTEATATDSNSSMQSEGEDSASDTLEAMVINSMETEDRAGDTFVNAV